MAEKWLKSGSWLAPDKSLCFLCAWILVKAASLHSYTTAFDAPREGVAYITSPLFQLGSSIGILASCMLLILFVRRGKIAEFSMPVLVPAAVLAATHLASIAGLYDIFPGEGAFFVVGAVWGVCTNMLALALIELLAAEKSLPVVATQLAMGSLAAAAIASFLQELHASWAALACVSFLVAASLLIPLCRKGQSVRPFEELASPAVCLRENLPVLLAFFVSEAILGMMNMFAYAIDEPFMISTMLPITGMTICAMLFLGVIALTSNAPNSQVLFMVVIPAMMALFLLLPFIGGSYGAVLSTILSGAYHFVAITATYCYVKTCREQGASIYVCAAIVCGIERAVLLLGLGLGLFLGSMFEGDTFMRITALAFVSLYALVLVVLASNWVRRRKGEARALDAREADDANSLALLVGEYGLTPREAEVLALLARGRDIGFISETLVLSRNTVQGYVKSIYVKMDVHSRRELHDVLEKSS